MAAHHGPGRKPEPPAVIGHVTISEGTTSPGSPASLVNSADVERRRRVVLHVPLPASAEFITAVSASACRFFPRSTVEVVGDHLEVTVDEVVRT